MLILPPFTGLLYWIYHKCVAARPRETLHYAGALSAVDLKAKRPSHQRAVPGKAAGVAAVPV
ncbi:hypothetical protein LTR84_007430 [Exophiala bonariae]|uniref:Uncharacterized protein n=1 Tax=Exophiala bonariae TaxID=1690606 RepID=A0AAV9MY56_9EURO|nr:hypothetical protein LTR84_007430 [Exophiala bonariae]